MKQRLVGTLVLGSLALILIPLLLDGEGVERPPLSSATPPAPAFETIAIPAPERPLILADALTPAATPADEPLVVPADAAIDAAPATAAGTADVAAAVLEQDSEQEAETSAPADGALNTEAAPVPVAAMTATAPPAAPEPVAEPEQSAPSSAPALDASGLPETWTVRLGSFGNRANADALVKRLADAGHKAYIRPVVTGQGPLNGVFVGPVLTRNEAVALQTELKSRFQINDAIVQRYDIAQ